MEETPSGSAQANPTNAMASPVPVVLDNGDGTAAPRERSAPSAAAAAAASPDIVGSSSRPPPAPMRRACEHPVLLDAYTPPTQRRRPPGSVGLGFLHLLHPWFFPVDLGAAGSGINGLPVSGSTGPGIAVIAEMQESSVGSASVSSAHYLPGASSSMALDNGDESERDNRESEEHALKFIVAEIDPTIIESGSVGGTLLRRFSEEGLRYRVTANPFRGSILWKMEVPQTGQGPTSVSEVPYILFVLQAEEFCNLIGSGSFTDHVLEVQSRYPTFTICYVTNGLMKYINMCEQSHYTNPSSSSWRRPPVEEVLSKLATHYAGVHSRQCADEADIAEHVVGLTSSLANCKFRYGPSGRMMWQGCHRSDTAFCGKRPSAPPLFLFLIFSIFLFLFPRQAPTSWVDRVQLRRRPPPAAPVRPCHARTAAGDAHSLPSAAPVTAVAGHGLTPTSRMRTTRRSFPMPDSGVHDSDAACAWRKLQKIDILSSFGRLDADNGDAHLASLDADNGDTHTTATRRSRTRRASPPVSPAYPPRPRRLLFVFRAASPFVFCAAAPVVFCAAAAPFLFCAATRRGGPGDREEP